jgi:ABC-type branched-subunit amino acid transport system substrate-binding protein
MVGLLCVFGAAACGGDDDDQGGAAATTPATTTSAGGGATSTSSAGATGAIDKSKPPARFALISLKIPGSDILGPFTAGAEAAAKALNAQGGFGGREVIIDSCNSQGSTTGATTCAHKTLAKDPIAEFGCEIRWGTTGLQIYSKSKIPSFNCPTAKEDITSPWNFSILPGGIGENRGMAQWLCKRPDVKKISFFTIDLPQLKAAAQTAAPVIKACGKQLSVDVFPENAADLTPYVTKAMQKKPDFVDVFPLSGAQGIQIFKFFHQAGFPIDHMGSVSSEFDYVNTLKPAGDAMDGMYGTFETASWGDTSNPDVTAYLDAMKGATWDARGAIPEQGYAAVMWFYTVAKQVGFDKFDSAALTQFMRTQTGAHIPLSHDLVNPGPKGFPQIKQPAVQIVQWKGGKLTTVQAGTDQCWVNAF